MAVTMKTRKPHFAVAPGIRDRSTVSPAAAAPAAVRQSATASQKTSAAGNSGRPFQNSAFTRIRLAMTIKDIAAQARATARETAAIGRAESTPGVAVTIGPTRTAEKQANGRRKKGSHSVLPRHRTTHKLTPEIAPNCASHDSHGLVSPPTGS